MTAQAPAAPEEVSQLPRYMAALRRFKWLIAATIVGGTAAGVALTRFIQPAYQAEGTIWIDQTRPGAGALAGLTAAPVSYNDVLTGHRVLDTVVIHRRLFIGTREPVAKTLFADFQLNGDPVAGTYLLTVDGAAKSYILTTKKGREMERGLVGDTIGRALHFSWVPPVSQLSAGRTIEFSVANPYLAANALRARLNINARPQGNLLTVSLSDPDPEEAAATLTAILEEFVNVAADVKTGSLRQVTQILRTQASAAQQDADRAARDLADFERNNATISFAGGAVRPGDPSQTPAFRLYSQSSSALEDLQATAAQLDRAIAAAQAPTPSVSELLAMTTLRTSSPELGRSLDNYQSYESQYLAQAALGRKLDHPDVVKYQGLMDSTRLTRIIPQAQSLRSEMAIRAQSLTASIDTAQGQLRGIPELTLAHDNLRRRSDAANILAQHQQDAYQSAQLNEISTTADVHLQDRPVVPLMPTSNTAQKLIALAFVGSIGGALALAILLDRVDRKFRYPEQATGELGLGILGAVPAIKRRRGGIADPANAAHVVEAFRGIRLAVAHSFEPGAPLQVAITSPGSGDGKSMVCANLALSFSDAGYRTLLIDGDIRRGEVHATFGVERRPGLLDCLAGQAGMDDVVHHTSHDRLSVIPCGTRFRNGPELVAAPQFQLLIERLRERFDAIIVDTPPLAAGIDPFALAAATGNLVLVLRAGETDRKLAMAKLEIMDRLPVRMLGAILNAVKNEGAYEYYAYLDGYAVQDEGTATALPAPSSDSTIRG